MSLIIVHRHKDSKTNNGNSFLRFALTGNLMEKIVLDGFGKYSTGQGEKVSFLKSLIKRNIDNMFYAVPGEWPVSLCVSKYKDSIVPYDNYIPIPSHIIEGACQKKIFKKWFVISNGRYFTEINENLLARVLDNINTDVVSINIEPGLLGEREKVRLTARGKIAGFRRQYCDSAKLCPVPDGWPAHLFVKAELFKNLLTEGSLSLSFSEIMKNCRAKSMNVCAIDVGGMVLDLESEAGLLGFCRMMLKKKPNLKSDKASSFSMRNDSRLTGKVLLGKNVKIGSKTAIIGPAVIGDNVIIEEGSVINSSIIDSDILIPRDQAIQNRVIIRGQEQLIRGKNVNYAESDGFNSDFLQDFENRFRTWSRFSYARLFKRIGDIVAATIVLILFAPLIPFIAAAIKLTSPGPVFYGDKRQGLHGKEFHCLKFRTMIAGANKIQENLRFVSQVDGPQFKMDDDPRISIVGRFLRETYIDEIPQFFNVLFGQMSVIGPRPSPESENTLCPFWRDARLSVKPGITGLWQIYRTRMPMKDFQEWIRYDTEYVRNLSLKTDLKIFWKTAKKLVDNFISQF